jgi:probable HAF family extracellular repeat protein
MQDYAQVNSTEKGEIYMKRFLFSRAFPIGMGEAALVGLAIAALAGFGQSITPPPSNDASVMVVERSELDYRLGHDAATKGSSIVMLGRRIDVPRRRFNGIDVDQFVHGTHDDPAFDAVRINSFYHDRAATDRRYSITDLGTLGGTESFAYAINDSSQVVGLSGITGDASIHSFLYSKGKMTDLYPLNCQDLLTVGPTDINNAGQIASGVVVGGVYVPAILHSRTGDLTLLGSLGGVTPYGFNGVATSINNAGNAVGYSYIDSINRHAFLYSGGVMTDIGSFGGYSGAWAINDEGVIVGFSSDQFNGVAHAFVDSDGVMTDIEPATESYARGVNNRAKSWVNF